MEIETPYVNGTVMIVDDTPGNLALLSDTLSEAGYRVLVATDGLAALEQIDYLKPDIILMDVLMPGIDGFETCRRLKADPLKADIPVLFMTGLSELDDLLRGFSEGGLDYIIKPIRPPEVLARIDVHLGLARDKRRAENALSQGTFSALTIDASGGITWLTPAAKVLLIEVMQPTASITINDYLPEPILAWAKKRLESVATTDKESADDYLTNTGFSIKMAPCQSSGEYLLLLKKSSREWNLASLKDSLGLTFREAEILMWISRGKTNKEVGLILESSHRTVNKHLEHIFEKLGVATRAAAVAIVLQRTDSR
ncbi:response regulator transcription factor [Methylobacter sp. S3L5C]|uniref:response regulator transcription factor n=1 Tax=Methylobacter sp. S3L5C TaxID=2839024 RepID=UPI001FACDA93|nr:response regulator transcription factor [Methylobacter sp. S3L5C]UOA10077.1 response regulator transcription factor [Methylobacter sp. S3L5C]